MKLAHSLGVWLACCVACRYGVSAPPTGRAEVVAVFTLPPIALGALQNAALADSLARDRRILLGSLGSDLFHSASPDKAADGKLEFWMLTDRGPNGHVEVAGKKRRTFLVPDFCPLIVRVTAQSGSIDVAQVLPITGQDRKPASGLPNLPTDEAAYDFTGDKRLPTDPRGIDPEGLVRTSQGDFWISEEYGPSLLHLDPQGKILARYVPKGESLAGLDYPVVEALPAVYRQRKKNHGFEGLAISADEKLLYLLLEGPLETGDKHDDEASRNARILVFSIAGKKCLGEVVYRLEAPDEFDPAATKRKNTLACAVAFVAPNRLLVLERTDDVSKVYAVDLRGASNLLFTPWHDGQGGSTLEALKDAAAAGLRTPTKSLVVDLSEFPQVPHKIEGLVILDRHQIAISNDNDFDLGTFDDEGNNIGNKKHDSSKIVVIRLPRPLY